MVSSRLFYVTASLADFRLRFHGGLTLPQSWGGYGRTRIWEFHMGDDVTFDKNFDLAPGVVDEVAPGVRRVLANNGGPVTLQGTPGYHLGRGKGALVGP